MNPPHGNKLVDRFMSAERGTRIRDEFDDYPSIRLDTEKLYDLLNLATGRYSPLTGYMNSTDFNRVIQEMALESGVSWPLPITLDVGAEVAEQVEPDDRLGLETAKGEPAGYVEVGEIYRYSSDETASSLFGTTSREHPGVRHVQNWEPFLVGGNVYVFDGIEAPVCHNCLTPTESRVLFEHYGWETVVGFQTRNSPHRAHEYIQKSALELTDGLFIHPKLGKKKPGDYTDRAILEGYDALVEHYYPSNAVVISPFPSRMLYAGPREAVFDAIIRKNHGCTHFIIGRDHAGVDDYYDDFAAQSIFVDLPDLGIEPMFFPYAFYCGRCDGMASEKTCPHDEDRVEPSGTHIRNTLGKGERPPSEMMRPEVAERINRLSQMFVH